MSKRKNYCDQFSYVRTLYIQWMYLVDSANMYSIHTLVWVPYCGRRLDKMSSISHARINLRSIALLSGLETVLRWTLNFRFLKLTLEWVETSRSVEIESILHVKTTWLFWVQGQDAVDSYIVIPPTPSVEILIPNVVAIWRWDFGR